MTVEVSVRGSRRLVRVLACLLLLSAACARTVVPPALPTALHYPEFVYPSVPQALQVRPAAARIDAGWRFLQNDDLANAAREFAAAVKRDPAFAPAHAGAGLVALARRDHDAALAAFGAALRVTPNYAPALVGRGQAQLALGRPDEALASFEQALAADESLADVRRRVDVLRFRNLQEIIDAARRAGEAGRLDEARAGYTRALEASPESAFLHREQAMIDRRRGEAAAALRGFRRAVELEPADVASLVQIGELLEEQRDFAGAEAAYREAEAIDGTPELRDRIAAVRLRARDAALPPQYRDIAAAAQITRGDLAALIGVQLEPLLRTAPERLVVMTDVRQHWAMPWITTVARAGVMTVFDNHTFQPRARVRRGDLAAAVSQLVALAARSSPALRARLGERPRIADVAPRHLSYEAVSTSVASGVLPLLDDGRFQIGRAVSGAEAMEAIARVRALAEGSR